MKNLDRIYGLSKSQQLLDELSSSINIDYFIRSQSNQLLTSYKEHKKTWDEQDSDYIVRAAIFIASKLRPPTSDSLNIISLSTILKDLPSLHDFMYKLKDVSCSIDIDPRIKSDIQNILLNYAFSLTLYNKYQELWNSLNISDQSLEDVKKTAWCIFLLSRVNLIQRRAEIVECACMLVATIYVVVTNCESFGRWYKSEVECLGYLSSLIKGQPDQIKISATHLRRMLELFLQHSIIRSDGGISGIFRGADLKLNYERLSLEYVHKLLPNEFDQRLFIEKVTESTENIVVTNKFMFRDVLGMEYTQVPAGIELKDLQHMSKCFIETYGNPELWVYDCISDQTALNKNQNDRLLELINDLHIKPLLDCIWETFSKLFTKFVVLCSDDDIESPEEVAVLSSLIVMNSIYKIKTVELEGIIMVLKIPIFELWKALDMFIMAPLPRTVYLYIREQLVLIETNLIWRDKVFLMQFKSIMSSKKDPEINFKRFSHNLLFYSGFIIKEISRLLYINDRVQEEIWGIFRSSIASETEILLNRNLHQIIICAIYGLCKAKSLNVTFNSIISRFTDVDMSSEALFRKIQLDDSTGDIIKYYNEEYLKYMKTYLLAVARNGPKEPYTNPLGISNSFPGLNISSQTPSNVFSPYFAPVSKKIFEFGESPIESLNTFNQMISKGKSTFLSFDDDKMGMPTKRPKHAEDIFQGEDMIDNLPEVLPGYKEDNL